MFFPNLNWEGNLLFFCNQFSASAVIQCLSMDMEIRNNKKDICIRIVFIYMIL